MNTIFSNFLLRTCYAKKDPRAFDVYKFKYSPKLYVIRFMLLCFHTVRMKLLRFLHFNVPEKNCL